MAVPLIPNATAASATSASATGSVPSGSTTGDLLFALVAYNSSTSCVNPSGWTQVADVDDDTSANRTRLLWRAASGSEPASYTWTIGSTFFGWYVQIARITGADTASPVDAFSLVPTAAGYTTDHDSPSVTTTGADRLILRTAVSARSRTFTAPAGTASVTSDVGAALASAAKATAGATGTATWVESSAGDGVTIGTLAINPAAGSGDVTPPTLSSATIAANGTSFTATLSESGCLPTSGTGGFTLSGTSAVLTAWTISGTTLSATLSPAALATDTVTYSYARAATTDDIADAAANYLADFSAASVTSNSTQAATLVAGAASFVSSGPTTISVLAAAPTGGSGSLSYQWERNASGGSYSDVGGATGLSLADSTASAGTLHGYRCKQTRGAGTVTTNAVTAQVYPGGALASGGTRKILGG